MTTQTIATTTPTGVRVSSSEPLYGEIFDFLIDEADLLDRDLHLDWLELLTTDIHYYMPARKTLYRRDGEGFNPRGSHFDDDKGSLTLRARRNVEIASAYDRDPAPRIRRLVSNVVVREGDTADEYQVVSSILVLRNRYEEMHSDTLSARREDILRRTPEGLRVARRTILVDQAMVKATWMNVFM
jgi:3-phenylpropionate/cinnamic acid dioxygenase small subunit